MSNALMAPRKNKRSEASRVIAQAIIGQYQPTNAEEMQDALKDIFGPMFEAMLQGEMDAHLGYVPNDHGSKDTVNRRNGYGHKSLKTTYGDVEIAVPRDRDATFEPQAVPKRTKDVSGIEGKHYWMQIFDEIRARGVKDVLYISMDGVSGLEEGARSIFKDAVVQRCIVHMIRNSVNLVENYMEDMSHRLKPTTMENKQFIINGKLLPYFGKLRVCDIDTIKIRKWQNELISYRDEDGKPFSQTYLKTVNNQLSALMNYAVSHYRLSQNPCKAAGSMGRSNAEEMNIWTQEQYERFSNAIQKSSVNLAFDMLFYTGMRSGELLALTPADILPSKRIDINKSYAKVKGEELFLDPKTPKAKRCISIPGFLYKDIQAYVAKLHGIEKGDRIFYFTKSALDKEIKRIAGKVGLPPIRVHDLRHSHASMLINLGFSALEIADRLGHESVKTTLDTYSPLYPDKDQQLADRLDQFRMEAPGENRINF